MAEWLGSDWMSLNDKEVLSVSLTKEQWEQVYQWYLVTSDDYRIEPFEKEAAEKIAKSLIGRFGSFR